MANFVNPVSFQNPEDQAALMEVQRRQALAQALNQQGMAPIQEQRGGRFAVPINPLQGVAKLAQTYAGMLADKSAQGGMVDLAKQQQARRAADIQTLLGSIQGSPAQPARMEEDASGNVTPMPAQGAMTPQQGLMRALPLLSPDMQQSVAPMVMQQMMKQSEPYTLPQGATRFVGNAPVAQGTPKLDVGTGLSALGKLVRERDALPPDSPMREAYDKAIEAEKAGPSGRPYYQFLTDESGHILAGNARTGEVGQPRGAGVPISSIKGPAGQKAVGEAHQTGEAMGKYTGSVQEDAAKSAVSNRYLDNMDTAAQNFNPGKLTAMQSSLIQWAQSMGVPVTEEDKKAAGSIQALTSMAIRMAGTATRQSDAQPSQLQYFKILESMPNEARSPEGFRQIMAYLRDTNNYNIIKHEKLTQWRAAHGGSAEGFEAEWPKMAAQVPLVWNQPGQGRYQPPAIPKTPGTPPQAAQPLTPQEQQELQALRKRFGKR